MATGIHSRLQSGRTPVKSPSPSPWYVDLPRRGWRGLSPRRRLALIAVVLLVIGGGLMMAQLRASNQPGELYPFAVAPMELRDMARELAVVGIPHDINSEGNNLLVAPARQEQARLYLRDRGLPRARPELQTREYSTMSPETASERQAFLEEQLRINLRQLEGVADASVQIAMPPPSYGMGDQAPTTACVKLEMQAGRSLDRQQVGGVVAMVSASVTDLKPENVQVVDQTGRVLTAHGGDEQQELLGNLQASLELRLNQKAQALLDHCFGVGRAFATVAVELDTSEIEIRRKEMMPNTFVVLQHRTDKESYGSDSEAPGAQMSAQSGGKSYNKICEITRGEASQSYSVKVDRMPRIKRLTCAVAMDRAAEAPQVRELMLGALGLDETRGDFVTVQTIAPPIVAEPDTPVATTAAPAPPQFSGWALGAGFLLAGLAALLAAGLRPRRPGSELAMEQRSTMVGIQDLRQTEIAAETGLRSTQRIEEYVRQVPNRAAATLKELWLQ